jgi:glucan phosphoethanolaminetransferase (alkaline phosphatase superfamily)
VLGLDFISIFKKLQQNDVMTNKTKEVIIMVVLSFIVLIPNLFFAIYGKNMYTHSVLKALLLLLYSFVIFAFPAMFLKKRTFFCLQIPLIFVAPLEIAHIFLNREPATVAFLRSMVNSSFDESLEMLLSVKFLLICLLFLWSIYFFLLFRRIPMEHFIKQKQIRRLLLLIFIALIVAGYAVQYNKQIYPYGFIYRWYQVFDNKITMNKGKKNTAIFRFNAGKADSITEREIYILVIGETSRYNNYSINGYQRNTSPLLSNIEGLVSYSDFFSEANITTTSLRLILTRATALDFERSYNEKTVVDAFREAGFKTYWVSNQRANSQFIHSIAARADECFFNTTKNFKQQNNFDEHLWKYLTKIFAKNDNKALIVLHTIGSHFRYDHRYPPEFEQFKPCMKGNSDINLTSEKNKINFVNSYDNSILYTDFFLAKTIQKLDSTGVVSAFIYLSDHGENLFDTEDNIVLHGGSLYTSYDFHIPFFVWTSQKYNEEYPAKRLNIVNNKDKKLCTENLFYSLLDIADITFVGQKVTKSIASEQLQPDSLRYIINTNMETKNGY